MKIYKVKFNDGDWHSGGLPSELVVASNSDAAIRRARKEHPLYDERWDAWATEVKFKGFQINIKKHGKKNKSK